ncbi:nicotinamide riboside transporter PnuC [Flavobacterium sp. I3-2]|uniref:nicotinamide riboside transporter PnuC n=1 Tax=Flavobacterium sp. I3-2 TaxID=2748319 RepID=UPI0015A75A6D|nr:nicotinamide riboside transporter PnuC [Flavobacterium sp. I3-2]
MMQDIFSQISILEWIGVSLAVVQVLLSRVNNPLNYLFGIGSIITTLFVMFENKLYAEFTLNLYYLVMSIYGWYFWKFGKQKQETSISYATNKDYVVSFSIVVFTFCLFYFGLFHFTDSDVPILDAVISAFAWAGMWLMAKRKIENWIFLNISNAIAIPLMIHKELYLYAILSLILFIVATSGYFKWKTLIKKTN